MGNRIKEWREERDLTLEELAEKTGISVSYLSRLESGKRNVSLKNLGKIGSALSVKQQDLVEGEELTVPVVGLVGAGAAVQIFSHSQGELERVRAPEGAAETTVAAEIRGESLGSFFDTWLVFYSEVRDPPTSGMSGKLCVCGLTDGRVLIKKLRRGSIDGSWTLLSQFEEPIYDVFLDWAAVVTSMEPR